MRGNLGPSDELIVLGGRQEGRTACGARRIAANAVWLMTSQTVSGLGNFIRLAMLARYLGPSELGSWGFAAALATFLTPVADFGLSILAVRDLARGEHPGAYYGTVVRLRVGVTLLLALLVVALSASLGKGADTRNLVILLSIQMLLASALVLVMTVFRYREQMMLEAVFSIALSLASLLLFQAMIVSRMSAREIAVGWILVTGAVLIAALAFVAGRFKLPPLSFDRQLGLRLVREAVPLTAALTLSALYVVFGRFFLGVTNHHTELGWYTAAYAPIIGLAAIITALRVSFMPEQSRALGAQERPKDVIRWYAVATVGLGLPLGILGCALAKPFLEITYGADYLGATTALRILSIGGALMFTSSFFGSHALVLGRNRRYLGVVALGAVANVALSLVLVPLLSLDGAAFAMVVSELVVTVLMARSVREVIPLRELLQITRWVLVGGAGMAVALLALQPFLGVIPASAFAGVVYLAAIARGLREDSRQRQASAGTALAA